MVKASIYPTDESGGKLGSGIICDFNPYEYTIAKSNTYSYKASNGNDSPTVNLDKVGAQTLKLKLIFDGYEKNRDVAVDVHKMWDFMNPRKSPDFGNHPNHKVDAPFVAFHWGGFKFVAVITQMSQKYTLFNKVGVPVRAEVSVTLTQHKDMEDYSPQNPTSGGGPIERVWRVKSGDRLDLIAASVYGDATKWQQIATYNDIDNPHALRSGSILNIPVAN